MISFKSSGSFNNMERFLKNASKLNMRDILEKAGQDGVAALASATPKDSGVAASSWRYEIRKTNTGISVVWLNSDTEGGFPVAVVIQYGYATGTGGYVEGRDYINPAMKPIFDRISDDIRKVVTSR